MDRDSIERIRSATFTIGRKGYDKREVERFLTQLAEWLETGGGDQARSDLVRRELERVGEKTGQILTSAHDAAEQVRIEAEEEITQLRDETDSYVAKTRKDADSYSSQARSAADDYSTTTRSDSDNYAAKTRSKADRDAEETKVEATREGRAIVEKAQAQAKSVIEEGNRRRQDIEHKIAELVSRRAAVLDDLKRLTGEISSAVGGQASETVSPLVDFGQSDEDGSMPKPKNGSAAAKDDSPPAAAGDAAPTNGPAKESVG